MTQQSSLRQFVLDILEQNAWIDEVIFTTDYEEVKDATTEEELRIPKHNIITVVFKQPLQDGQPEVSEEISNIQ